MNVMWDFVLMLITRGTATRDNLWIDLDLNEPQCLDLYCILSCGTLRRYLLCLAYYSENRYLQAGV